MFKGPEVGSCLVCSRDHKGQVEVKQNEPEESMGDEVSNARGRGEILVVSYGRVRANF